MGHMPLVEGIEETVTPRRGFPIRPPAACACAPSSAAGASCAAEAAGCPFRAWAMTSFASLIGMHMPMLSMLAPLEYRLPLYFSVGMPISCPAVLNMPPPLFPLLIAASVWIMVFTAAVFRPKRSTDSLSLSISRSSPETMPAVTVPVNPIALPMLTTQSPTTRSSLSPISTGSRGSPGTYSTARSLFSSEAATVAS